MHTKTITLPRISGITMLAGALVAAGLPVAAQDVTSTDLAEIMPATIAGAEVRTNQFSVASLADLVDTSDPIVVATLDSLDGISEAIGVPLEQMTYGSATVAGSELDGFLVATTLQAAGVEGADLIEPFFGFHLARNSWGDEVGRTYFIEPTEIAGKDVFMIHEETRTHSGLEIPGGPTGEVMYGTGDVAMILEGDEALIFELLAALP